MLHDWLTADLNEMLPAADLNLIISIAVTCPCCGSAIFTVPGRDMFWTVGTSVLHRLRALRALFSGSGGLGATFCRFAGAAGLRAGWRGGGGGISTRPSGASPGDAELALRWARCRWQRRRHRSFERSCSSRSARIEASCCSGVISYHVLTGGIPAGRRNNTMRGKMPLSPSIS